VEAALPVVVLMAPATRLAPVAAMDDAVGSGPEGAYVYMRTGACIRPSACVEYVHTCTGACVRACACVCTCVHLLCESTHACIRMRVHVCTYYMVPWFVAFQSSVRLVGAFKSKSKSKSCHSKATLLVKVDIASSFK